MTKSDFAKYTKTHLRYFMDNWKKERVIADSFAIGIEQSEKNATKTLLQAMLNEVYRGFSVTEKDLPKITLENLAGRSIVKRNEHDDYCQKYLVYFFSDWDTNKITEAAWTLAEINVIKCSDPEKEYVHIASLLQAIVYKIYASFGIKPDDFPIFATVIEKL